MRNITHFEDDGETMAEAERRWDDIAKGCNKRCLCCMWYIATICNFAWYKPLMYTIYQSLQNYAAKKLELCVLIRVNYEWKMSNYERNNALIVLKK